MSPQSFEQPTSVTTRSNWLVVDDCSLRADTLKDTRSDKLTVSPEQLQSVLLLGRRSIVQGIEGFYQQQVTKNPGSIVTRPSIWTAQLGTSAQTDGRDSKVFTEKGYDNGGIVTSLDEVQLQFHDHWNAVYEAGFVPEIRRTSGGKDGGSWLLLRKPSLDEVLEYWFDQNAGVTVSAAESVRDENRSNELLNLHEYRMMREKSVDQKPDEERSRVQVGLILSMAAIKSTLGDKNGYEKEIDDAFTYADNDEHIDVSAVRAMENSTYL